MTNPIDTMKRAECIHGTYTATRSADGVTSRHCDLCGACLDFDEVYVLLYTRIGRTRLLAAFLEREGIAIPAAWEHLR